MIGQENGPNILMLSSLKADNAEALITWAKKLAGNPTTLWHNLDTSFSLLEEKFPTFIGQYGLSEKQGYFVIERQPDIAEINNYVYRFLFFLFPAAMEPLQAMESLDQQQNGTLPPALVAAMVAAAHGFEFGNLTLEGPPSIIASVAGQLPATGTSTLSDTEIMNQIKQVLNGPNQSPIQLVNTMPISALDRARFLVTLSEVCWQPAFRHRLIRIFGFDPAFARIASAWLSS